MVKEQLTPQSNGNRDPYLPEIPEAEDIDRVFEALNNINRKKFRRAFKTVRQTVEEKLLPKLLLNAVFGTLDQIRESPAVFVKNHLQNKNDVFLVTGTENLKKQDEFMIKMFRKSLERLMKKSKTGETLSPSEAHSVQYVNAMNKDGRDIAHIVQGVRDEFIDEIINANAHS